MQRLIEEPYLTPKGKLDIPFAYVFDATKLTDGLTIYNLAKALQGDSDFVLRRIVGVNNCVNTPALGGAFNYKNPSGSYTASPTTIGIRAWPNWVVLPEKVYSYNTQISFDLFNVLRDFNACSGTPIYTSYIAFFGVKRLPVQSGYRSNTTPYRYKEKKYTYSINFTLTQAHLNASGGTNAPIRFSQLIDNYDFELQRISISYANAIGNTGALTSDDFLIQLYDPNMHQLSDMPLNQSYVNNGKSSQTLFQPYGGIFPVPPLVYPAGAAITFDVTSMLCSTSVPQSYNIIFEGIWRIPC